MPNYRRLYIPGGTYFFTIVTYCRRPLFKDPRNVDLLRSAIAKVKIKQPFKDVSLFPTRSKDLDIVLAMETLLIYVTGNANSTKKRSLTLTLLTLK